MQAFRKKPVVVEAIQLEWENWPEICDFVGVPENGHGVMLGKGNEIIPEGQGPEFSALVSDHRLGMVIHTLEGDHIAQEHDWIIKGVAGEFYPCKPDIFAATYDAVDQ